MRRFAALVAVCVCAVSVSAQRGVGQPPPGSLPQGRQTLPNPPQSAPPQFRSRVDLVYLDVSVLDGRRRPVRGLQPADFLVLENGVPQDVSVFSAVDIQPPEPVTAPWMRAVSPDVRSNEDLRERRLFLLIIDDATIYGDPFALKNVKQIAQSAIKRFGPGDLAGIVYTMNNKHSQDFTTDHGRLLKAVDQFSGGFRGMGGEDTLYFGYSVSVVQSAVKTLATLPDRRKSILYISSGVPVDLELAATPQSPGIPEGGLSGLARQGPMNQMKYQMSDTFRQAERANVNVYTIDPCGIRVLPAPNGPRNCVPGLDVEYLFTVAGATGGRAVANTNDFDTGLTEIFEENAAYYLLGYQSSNPTLDGKLRRLDVRVNRPDVEVRTRSGYLADKPDAAKRKAELAASPLGAALSGVLPKTDLPMQLTAAPIAIPGKKESAVAVVLGVKQPIRQSGARTIERVDLQVMAFDVNGKPHGTSAMRADVTVRAAATGLAEYEVLSRINLKPGRYQLRIAANVGSLQTAGSLYYDVDVPNFQDAPVSLSGLVLSAQPSVPVAPRDALKGLLPVVPTTRREFVATDQASVFVRIYQGGKGTMVGVPVRVQLRDANDTLVMDRDERISAATFNTERWADVNIALPLGRLASGSHLLTIESTVGRTTARRDLRFTRR